MHHPCGHGSARPPPARARPQELAQAAKLDAEASQAAAAMTEAELRAAKVREGCSLCLLGLSTVLIGTHEPAIGRSMSTAPAELSDHAPVLRARAN
jgi:hypothetical protein